MKILKLALPIFIFIATLAAGLMTAQAQGPDLTDGLIAHWKLNETSGTRADSHNNYDLSSYNSVGYDQGKIGDSSKYTDGSAQYLYLFDTDFQFSGDFTIAAWVYYDQIITDQSANFIWYKNGTFTKGWGLRFRDWTNNEWQFLVGDGSNTTASITDNSQQVSQWYFLVAWHDDTANKIYIQLNDGTPQSKNFASAISYDSDEFIIGDDHSIRVDSVSIWNRVLTDTERTSLYNSGLGLDYERFNPNNIYVTVNLTPTIQISPTFNITNNVILTPTTPYTSIINPHTNNEIHIERVVTHGDILIATPIWFLVLMALYWRTMIVIKGH